jgi:dihydrofolate reductase
LNVDRIDDRDGEIEMARIIAWNRVSADGYFAAPDGNLDWVVPDEELDSEAAKATASAGQGALMFGRKTYEIFESFWPKVAAGTVGTNDPHNPGRNVPEMHDLGVFIDNARKYVVSKSKTEVTWKNSRLLREVNRREIEAIKTESEKDILLFGSGSLASQLTELGLIDEYQFVVCPILLGDGRSLLSKVAKQTKLVLKDCKAYKSGNMLQRYERRA